ncbi:uncharacterized protein LOC121926389 [Sceloporus undulatus]|uniref:uncharacterized protein LOC121926389 n=1 Tax=Sceloporus undulatus TaxID=8520 RepID=UPI001C4B921E|nr:uncharacterized protein LOC121926389 [Sceloporus undulatus]
MEDPLLISLPADIQDVIMAAQKPSTRRAYSYKWDKFLAFLNEKDIVPSQVSISTILGFLMSLANAGLSLNSIKCYLSAISSHYTFGDKPSLFRNSLVKRFLRGFNNLHPPCSSPSPAWSLELVLSKLTSKPFEPMATTDLRLLTWKTAFLVAITSARRAGELCALRADQPYIRFHRDKVVLRADITFLPKVVSAFHLNQDIILPILAPNPSTDEERRMHSLDVRRALAFYLDRTLGSRLSNRLFVCYSEAKKGLPVSSQRFSKWVSNTIYLCYELAGVPAPVRVRAHATRAEAASSAFLMGIPLEDVCRAATWSQPLTFIRHYRLDSRDRQRAAFGRAVLLSGLH